MDWLGHVFTLFPATVPVIVGFVLRKFLIRIYHSQSIPAAPAPMLTIRLADCSGMLEGEMCHNYPKPNYYVYACVTFPYEILFDPYTRIFTIVHKLTGKSEEYHIEELQNFNNSDTDFLTKLTEKVQQMHDRTYPAQALKRKLGVNN